MEVSELVGLIQAAVPEAEVYARDTNGGGDHYEAFVISSHFEGLMSLKRHKIIMDSLAEALKGPLHAIALKTYTPSEWQKAQEGK